MSRGEVAVYLSLNVVRAREVVSIIFDLVKYLVASARSSFVAPSCALVEAVAVVAAARKGKCVLRELAP